MSLFPARSPSSGVWRHWPATSPTCPRSATRADEVKFETVLSATAREQVAFATAGENYISRQAGGVTRTGNPLDFAVNGDAFFAIDTGNGPAFTRDGRMQIDEFGELRTLNGYPVLDAGLAPIQLDARRRSAGSSRGTA